VDPDPQHCLATHLLREIGGLLATAALWVRIQTFLKNTKWATYSPPKNYTKNNNKYHLQSLEIFFVVCFMAHF
jgi:hypothetical protein